MVAYSFQERFYGAVQMGVKRQTVRADRKRHARPGEAMQLYVFMRTQACRKIREDVVCESVHRIEIVTSRMIDGIIASISIDWIPLNAGEIEDFAHADGFRELVVKGEGFRSARRDMGEFWLKAHGEGRFEGVLIRWRP